MMLDGTIASGKIHLDLWIRYFQILHHNIRNFLISNTYFLRLRR